MEAWWFVIKIYENGQWEKFKLYSDEDTARRIGSLINPRAQSAPKQVALYTWKGGDWVDVSKKA